jgi:hypothetical protein
MSDSFGAIRFVKRPPAVGDLVREKLAEEVKMSVNMVKDGRPIRQETHTVKTFERHDEVVGVAGGDVSALKIAVVEETTTLTTKANTAKVVDPFVGRILILEKRDGDPLVHVRMADGAPVLLHEENQLRARYKETLSRYRAMQRALPDEELHIGDRMDAVARAVHYLFERMLPHATLSGAEAALANIQVTPGDRLGTIEFKIAMMHPGNPVNTTFAITGTTVALDVKGNIALVDSRRPNRMGVQSTNGKGTVKASVQFAHGPVA